MRLCAVIAVDGDVLVRQIAGPNRRGAISRAQVCIDNDLGRLESSQRLVLIKRNGQTLAAYGHAHDIDGHIGLLKEHAAFAKRHSDAAPVAVVTGNCGFDQRGVCHGARGGIGVPLGCGTRHVNGYEL